MRAWSLTLTLALFGCKTDDTGDSGPTDLGFGEACDGRGQCATGLTCAGDGACRYDEDPGTWPEGMSCESTQQCAWGLECTSGGACAPSDTPGTASLGEACDTDVDCTRGLACGASGKCEGWAVPLWPGGDCPAPGSDPGGFRVYFEVPGEAPLTDFYKLPFPNDIRVVDGKIDLEGHPSPGALAPELGDVVGELYASISEDVGAFGNNQAVFFRFSQQPDFDTMKLGLPGEGTLAVVDITPGSETYGVRHTGFWNGHTARKQYLCHNWLALYPSPGRPYQPGHTYAALVSTGVKKRDSDVPAGQDADLVALLSEAPPVEERLARAWQLYQPLRDFLAEQPYPNTVIAGASVFTVQDPTVYPERLRVSARDTADAPTVTGLVSCESGEPGPYADADDPTRGCDAAASSEYLEVQGRIRLPQYQKGIPPFKDGTDGGAIDFSIDPLWPQRYEEVTLSITVPRGVPMPEAGWPVVLYAHGTGGNYRSAVTGGVASDLSDVALADGSHARFATLAIDGVMHGRRRSQENWKASWLEVDPQAYDPDKLFFNPLNPRAARDNALQHAADWFSVVRWLEGPGLDAATSPTGEAIRFDTSQVYYLGHSQGAVAGMTFLPFEPGIRAVVLSGGGALLIESLLGKQSPYDVPNIVRVALADAGIDRRHPVLNLVQGLAERGDGVNYAKHLFREPRPDVPAKHVLQVAGVGDTYTPDPAQYALARGLYMDQVAGASEPFEFLDELTEPVTANQSGGVTGVVRLYEPVGARDAHFVIFDREDARAQYAQFLATAARDGTPTLIAPGP